MEPQTLRERNIKNFEEIERQHKLKVEEIEKFRKENYGKTFQQLKQEGKTG